MLAFFFFVLFQTLNWFKGEVGDRGLQLSASLQLTLALRSQIRQSLNAGTLTKLAKWIVEMRFIPMTNDFCNFLLIWTLSPPKIGIRLGALYVVIWTNQELTIWHLLPVIKVQTCPNMTSILSALCSVRSCEQSTHLESVFGKVGVKVFLFFFKTSSFLSAAMSAVKPRPPFLN